MKKENQVEGKGSYEYTARGREGEGENRRLSHRLLAAAQETEQKGEKLTANENSTRAPRGGGRLCGGKTLTSILLDQIRGPKKAG